VNTLEEFQMAASFGSPVRIDTINGRPHYVTVNREGRAMIGPKAHRRPRWWSRNKNRVAGQSTPDLYKRLEDLEVREGLAALARDDAFAELAAQPTIDLTDRHVDEEFAAMTEDMEHEQWLVSQKGDAEEVRPNRLMDPAWHFAVKHTALDVLTWSLAVGALLVVAKLVMVVWSW